MTKNNPTRTSASGKEQNIAIILEIDSALSNKWFSDNYMKLNEEKCHLITLGINRVDAISIKADSFTVHESNQEKLLGFIISLHFISFIIFKEGHPSAMKLISKVPSA